MPVFFQIRFSSFTLFSLISCQKPSKNRIFCLSSFESLDKTKIQQVLDFIGQKPQPLSGDLLQIREILLGAGLEICSPDA